MHGQFSPEVIYKILKLNVTEAQTDKHKQTKQKASMKQRVFLQY